MVRVGSCRNAVCRVWGGRSGVVRDGVIYLFIYLSIYLYSHIFLLVYLHLLRIISAYNGGYTDGVGMVGFEGGSRW